MESTIPCHNTLLVSGGSWQSLAFQALQTHTSSRCLHSPPGLSPRVSASQTSLYLSRVTHHVIGLCTHAQSVVSNSSRLCTVARQAPLSTGFPRQAYCSGFPCPIPGDLPKPGIKPESLALAGRILTAEPLSHRGSYITLYIY